MSGAEYILVEHLRNTDAPAEVLAPAGELLTTLEENGITARRSRFLGELRRDERRLWPLTGLVRASGATLEIVRLARDWRPDVLVANNFAAGLCVIVAATLLRRPWIWFIYDLFPPDSLELKILRRFANSASALVAASDAVRRHLESSGIPPGLIHVVYNGVDTERRFVPEIQPRGRLRLALDVSSDTPLVAFIGHLAPHKGPQLLVQVAPELFERHHVHVALVGTFPPQQESFKQSLYQRVTELEAESYVHFTGHLDPATVLNDVDIVVVPSLFPDPLPTVVLEAMAMRKVVVAADVGGIPEMITHGVDGYLFAEGDADGLLDLLLAVLDRPPLEVGDAARERVRDGFNLSTKISSFNSLIEKVVDNK